MAKKKQDKIGKAGAREEQFVEALFANNFNVTRAGIDIGFAENSAPQQASRLLKTVKVQNLINKRIERIKAHTDLSITWVLDHLQEVVQRCMEEVPVRNRMGEIIEGAWTFDSNGANKALELIGKYFGMYTDKHDLSGTIEMAITVPGDVDEIPV